ncbi:hypothetical protein MPH_12171 [Macrophomina phaseolina MS6]|uniref:Uncharacterized protein n=1 Tax=Macrophomina phaseolina (strain MS6) TaxID=1126212 RepID=K2RCQ6_MACPH|nr:hypothetical protein MPH_12171 [Macrophomina phaseolina MS6]
MSGWLESPSCVGMTVCGGRAGDDWRRSGCRVGQHLLRRFTEHPRSAVCKLRRCTNRWGILPSWCKYAYALFGRVQALAGVCNNDPIIQQSSFPGSLKQPYECKHPEEQDEAHTGVAVSTPATELTEYTKMAFSTSLCSICVAWLIHIVTLPSGL